MVTLEHCTTKLNILKLAMVEVPSPPSTSTPGCNLKVRIPEPTAYGGARIAKGLENFIWDIEQYFRVPGILKGEKVQICMAYLVDNTKPWWRTHIAPRLKGDQPTLQSWDNLKKELKAQFLPMGTSWIAREVLTRLKQMGSI